MAKDKMDRRTEALEEPAEEYRRTSYHAALVERFGPQVTQRYLQRRAERLAASESGDSVHEAAAHGTSGASGPLPYAEQIQRSFGRHDITKVQAHSDGAAAEGAAAMGAEAFASGDHVAFAGAPDLHTAAHEAAHVVQQRAGVQLTGGVGEAGDVYERHADAVADKVVKGESAEALLDEHAGAEAVAAHAGEVQRILRVKREDVDRHGFALIPNLQPARLQELFGRRFSEANWPEVSAGLAQLAAHAERFEYTSLDMAVQAVIEHRGADDLIRVRDPRHGIVPVYEHDAHGSRKHFNGNLREGSQWSLPLAEAEALMLRMVQANLRAILENSPNGQISLFYLTALRPANIGIVGGGGATRAYTMQIDVDRSGDQPRITYHGYPVEEGIATLGLGRTVRNKGLPFTDV